MSEIYYFSGSGHTLAVAEFLGGQMGCPVTKIGINKGCAETAVVVFPVYCQNIPQPVKTFLKKLDAKYVALIATYGKIAYGNVLWEAQKLVRGTVIAGAYVPTGHSFLNQDSSFPGEKLLPILQRLEDPQQVCIPKLRKDLLADIFPAWRSRVGVKILKSDACRSCGQCERNCPMGAIRNGIPNSACIRCLRCVTDCPQEALRFENTKILTKYLNHYHNEEFVLYL